MSLMTNNFYLVRPYKPEDRNFILSTFLRGLYYGNDFYALIDKAVFMTEYKKVVEALIDSPFTSVKVACLPDDKDVVLGYAIASVDGAAIHWGYVKAVWRDKGIFKALLPATPQYFTHFTMPALAARNQKAPNLIFNPFYI